MRDKLIYCILMLSIMTGCSNYTIRNPESIKITLDENYNHDDAREICLSNGYNKVLVPIQATIICDKHGNEYCLESKTVLEYHCIK